MKLSDLTIGKSGVILSVHTQEALAARLKMLNVYAGGSVRMLRRAPFGGGYMLEAGGVRLALRRSIADEIEVRILEEEEKENA